MEKAMEPSGNLVEIVAAVSAAVAAIIIGVQKAWKAWGEGRTGHSRAEAQIEVIDQLREELVRMAVQNTKLAECLNALQLEVINLRSENADLHTTVRHLHSEVRRLRQAGATSGFGGLDEHVR